MLFFSISAKHYPSAMLSRACNYETKDMLAFVSFLLVFVKLFDNRLYSSVC